MARAAPSMDAVVKVFCTHTEPNFSLPWQRKRQYSSSSSGFVIGGRRVLTNAHSVEHYTQVKLKKRGSDTKYVATVLAIGTECDIGESFVSGSTVCLLGFGIRVRFSVVVVRNVYLGLKSRNALGPASIKKDSKLQTFMRGRGLRARIESRSPTEGYLGLEACVLVSSSTVSLLGFWNS